MAADSSFDLSTATPVDGADLNYVRPRPPAPATQRGFDLSTAVPVSGLDDLSDVYSALQKADAAGDTAGARQLAQYIRARSASAAQQAPQSTSPQEPPTVGSWLKNNLAVPLARAGINAVTALPLMAQDLGVAGRDIYADATDNGIGTALSHLVHGPGTYRYPYELPSRPVQQAIEPYLPAPTNTAGKVGEFLNSALVGGAASGAGIPGLTAPTYGNVPAAFVSPRTSGLNAAQQNAADVGEALGMRLTPGQRSGSVALQQLESKLQSQPWTSGPFSKLSGNNQSVLNSAWSKAIGESGEAPDSIALARAADRLGNVFESARSANNVIAVNPKNTTAALGQVATDSEGLLKNGASILDHPLVKKLTTLMGTGGEDSGYLSNLTMGANQPTVVNGQQLGALTSRLGKAAYNEMSTPVGDRELGKALYAVKDHVDDLLQSGLSGSDSAAYSVARQQYRALMQLTGRVANVNPNTGNVSGSSIANYLQAKDKPGFLFGKNQSDAYNAVRFAQAFKPIIGDSGTATRASSLGHLTDMPLSIPANFLSRAYLSRPGAATVRGLLSAPDVLGKSPPPEFLSGLLQGLSQPSLWNE